MARNSDNDEAKTGKGQKPARVRPGPSAKEQKSGSYTKAVQTGRGRKFMQEVVAEMKKVTWPNRREVMLTTVMVFIMAALAATFFSLVDLGIRSGLSLVVGGFGA